MSNPEVSIVMEINDWLLIDGVMDNEIQSLRRKSWESEVPDTLDPHWVEISQLGESIREAGWKQLPDWPKTEEDLRAWPTPGRTEAMRLSTSQWGLVVASLDYWARIEKEDGDDEAAAPLLRISELVRTGFRSGGAGAIPSVGFER